jgi:BlaI family penicillinase repressor
VHESQKKGLTRFFHNANFLADAKNTAGARAMTPASGLSRRERQIMDILYQRGKSSASEVREAMANAPSYSAVRAMLRILEEKGHIAHRAEGLKYVYLPTIARDKAKR